MKKSATIITFVLLICGYIVIFNLNNIDNFINKNKFDKLIENPGEVITEDTGTWVLLAPINKDRNSILINLDDNKRPLSSMELDGYYDELDNHRQEINGVYSNEDSELILTNNEEKKSAIIDFKNKKLVETDYITTDNFDGIVFDGNYTIFKDIGNNITKTPLYFTEDYLMEYGSEENGDLLIIVDCTIF